jgi:hypothetical protein
VEADKLISYFLSVSTAIQHNKSSPKCFIVNNPQVALFHLHSESTAVASYLKVKHLSFTFLALATWSPHPGDQGSIPDRTA